LVAFAALVSAGLVAADHIEMPVYSESSSLSRFELYTWAASWTEEESEFEAMEAANSIDARMRRLDRFGQYSLALELAEQTRSFADAEDMGSSDGYWCTCYDLMNPGDR
jgi:hypothetical protein